jgi:RHS repeat-associated protein
MDGDLTTGYGDDTLARIITRTNQVNGQPAYALQLGYNSVGQLISRTETVSGTSNYSYTYDLDGQLTKVARNGIVSEQYVYDVNGNQISQQLGGGSSVAATYDSQDRLQQLGASAYQFNADGFLTQRGSDSFHYNVRGQLLQAVVAGQTISYTYDGLGRRAGRTDSAGTNQYLYGDPSSDQVTAVRSPASGFTALYYDTSGMLIALERAGARYYVATDQVGTPRVVSNSAGAIVKVVAYDSFGRLLSDSNPAFNLPLGYAGGLADAVTGLVHFGQRDYDVASGRWTARDPALFDGGQVNLYVYVGNSPVSHRDPTGLFCVNVSLYDGIGFGVQTCLSSDGASICGEVGFGVGGGASVDSDGLAKDGGKIGVEGSLRCGVLVVGADITLDTDGCLKGGPLGQIGALKGKEGKVELKPSVWEGLPSQKLDAECSAAGKLYGKVCHQEKL